MAGFIQIEDLKGKKSLMGLEYATDLAALKTFAGSLDSYTNGKCTLVGIYVDPTVDTPTASDPTDGKLASVEDKALLRFYYIEANVKHWLKLTIPAPDDDTINHVDKTGYRYVVSAGDSIAAMLSTLTGKTVKYQGGSFQIRKTRPQD